MDVIKIKAIIFLTVTLVNVLLALLIWSRKRKDKTAFYLGWTAFFSGAYTFAMGGGYIAPLSDWMITLFGKLTWLGVLIIPSFATSLYYSSGETTRMIRIKASLFYLTAITIAIIGINTNWFTARVWIENTLIRTEGGRMEYLGRIYIFLATLLILFTALKYYLRTSGFRRLQARYFLWGVAIFALSSLIGTGLIPIIFKNLTDIAVEVSSLFSFMWVGLTGYAILRYRLFDIRLVLGKIGIYGITASVVIGVALLLGFLNLRFFNLPLSPFLVIIAIVILALASPIYLFFERMASRYFYYTLYSFRRAFQDLSKQLNQTIELNKLTALIESSFLEAFKLDKVSIVLKEVGAFKVQTAMGLQSKDISYLLGRADNFLIKYLKQIQQPIVTEEILFIIQEGAAPKKQLGEEEREQLYLLQKEMDKLQIGLLAPLFIKDELIGIIVLGKKLSGDAYSEQELGLLSTLTAQVAVALNNALSYEEIQRRKEELEKFYRLTIGRELKMVELKNKIKELEEEKEK